MKKLLAIALAVFATSAIAEGNAQSASPQSHAIQGTRASSLAVGNGWELRLSDLDGAPASTASVASQVLYEVALSQDGKLLKSLTILTNNGGQGTAMSEDIAPYLTSCESDKGCSTGELHSGLMLVLSPRVAADGSILTSCQINVSTLRRGDDFSTTTDFYTYRGQEMTIAHNGLSLTIRATVV